MTSTVLDFNSALTQDRLEEVLKRRTVDAEDVRARLHGSAESFIKWLFSGRALISRGQARIGDTSGTPGGSLSISLSGASAGLWSDHATGDHGDLIGLYMAYMGYPQQHFVHALKEIAAEFLGDKIEVQRPAWQESAARRIEKKATELGTKPRADMVELGPKVADWKYHDLHGNIIASVARYEPEGQDKTYRPFCFRLEDGKQTWRMGAPTLRPLYRLPEIVTCQTVVLTEGEKCAQALADLGIDATTAMQGAHAPVEKTDWSSIQGKTVIIWPDNDAAGFEYARKVADHLRAIGCAVSLAQVPPGKPEKWDAADCVAEGQDPREVIATAVAAPQAEERFKLYTLEELADLPPPEWLIETIITENGISQLWAGSDSYKSFVAIDFAMCIGSGCDWHGFKVKQGLALYFAAEDENGVKMRMLGWVRTKGKDKSRPNVRIMRDSFELVGPDGDAIIRSISMLEERPKLIVIDTLAKTFGPGDENKTPDMNAYVAAAEKLRRATGANIMIVHHAGRDAERERGNVALRAGCNTIIAVKRDGDKIKLINAAPQGKQKNAEPFKDISLRMQKVHFEHAGKEQSTLVVMLDDNPVRAETDTAREPEFGLGANQQVILRLLRKNGSLGFNRLQLLSKIEKGNLSRCLKTLSERGLVARDSDLESAQWRVVDDE